MKNNKTIFKMSILALFAAIGVVLMSYIQIPWFVPFSFLKIEISDFVIILTLLIFGFKEAVLVAIIKTLGDLLFRGPVGLYAIGQITAFIASMSYCFGMLIFQKLTNNKKLPMKILGYAGIVLVVTLVMVISNYLILTRVYLTTFGLTPNDFIAMAGANNYLLAIIIAYVPFNLVKGTLVVGVAATIGDAIIGMFRNRFHLKKSDSLDSIT